MVVAAEGAGPFDSHVGTLALGNALVTGVAGRLRHSADPLTPPRPPSSPPGTASDALLDP